ncbi:MAG TPA: DNA-formamidopyrimidine glycosylase family protein [Gaiellaceae bacterium]|nr:DNA-formamidopyrimidine glycosylase family protein [Gaiellaceae bacterium]
MPEGDSLHRAAARLQVLVGQKVEVESPHPRAAAKRLAERLDGRTLERVEAKGKSLYLSFAGGLVLRSHLRMNGRWRVEPRGTARRGMPWLVLRGDEYEAVQWNGPILELVTDRYKGESVPDIVTEEPTTARFRSTDQRRAVGDALLDQRLVAGIGNMWKAEALWEARVSPWRRLADVSDDELAAVLETAHRAMQASVEGTRPLHHVYRRAGRACHRCGAVIRSAPQGEHARTAYWCPKCQAGGEPPPAS